MTGRSVSAVTAYTAHREWASRPPDERYASVHALYEAARARHARIEERATETVDLRTEALDTDDLAIRNTSGRTAALTHWSFGQLATIASAPPSYLRTLPAPIASEAINYGLRRFAHEQYQLFIERTAPWTVHAITSPRYARVQHHELASRVLDLMAQHPAWHLPLGYKDGEYGAERVPSGAYLGDRDMFLFLVDGNRDLDDPTDRTHAGLFRGFILRNSDVGAAALTLDVFLFGMVLWESRAPCHRTYERLNAVERGTREMPLGQPAYPAGESQWGPSACWKRRDGPKACTGRVRQGPRDRAKATLLELQAPAMHRTSPATTLGGAIDSRRIM